MKPKVVAFDVDETLGNFSQFSYFGHTLGQYFNKPDIMYRYFNDLVDLYPEIVRPNMVRILDYIRKKKNAGICSKVMIYTTIWVLTNGSGIFAVILKINCGP